MVWSNVRIGGVHPVNVMLFDMPLEQLPPEDIRYHNGMGRCVDGAS